MITHWLRLTGVLSVVTLLLLSACKKDDGLPPATQEGKNTFGCKVNGKAWVPNGGSGFMGAKAIEGGFYDVYKRNSFEKRLGVYIRAHMKNGEYINLYLQESQVGKYQLNKNTSILPNDFYPENYGAFYSNSYFITNSVSTGEITITRADTINLQISGIFQFTGIRGSGSSQQTVSITDGRFDINMKTLN